MGMKTPKKDLSSLGQFANTKRIYVHIRAYTCDPKRMSKDTWPIVGLVSLG
jgi:hypothetical protein